MSLDGMDGEARFYSKYTTLTVIQVLALAIKTKLKNNHCCRVLENPQQSRHDLRDGISKHHLQSGEITQCWSYE